MPVGKTYDVPVKSPDRFYIGGEWVTPSSADLIDVIQPATEDVWVRIAAARTADVHRAVAAARQAFDTGPWPRLTHAQRAEYLRAIGAGLRERAADL
ncbi:MAG TPA: aldehyde dehydrogenase family protein, partial [Streptosporangiaceae bacterium]|nr:aldehyde dehydrogenase family protein [Streptosporangiaceae bacterium]